MYMYMYVRKCTWVLAESGEICTYDMYVVKHYCNARVTITSVNRRGAGGWMSPVQFDNDDVTCFNSVKYLKYSLKIVPLPGKNFLVTTMVASSDVGGGKGCGVRKRLCWRPRTSIQHNSNKAGFGPVMVFFFHKRQFGCSCVSIVTTLGTCTLLYRHYVCIIK